MKKLLKVQCESIGKFNSLQSGKDTAEQQMRDLKVKVAEC